MTLSPVNPNFPVTISKSSSSVKIVKSNLFIAFKIMFSCNNLALSLDAASSARDLAKALAAFS